MGKRVVLSITDLMDISCGCRLVLFKTDLDMCCLQENEWKLMHSKYVHRFELRSTRPKGGSCSSANVKIKTVHSKTPKILDIQKKFWNNKRA